MGIAMTDAVTRAFHGLLRGRLWATVLVLAVAMLIGGGLTLWAQLRLNAVLAVSPREAEIGMALVRVEGDCGTPAFYIRPAAAGGATDYRVLLDLLGGPNRFPGLGGATASAVLALPESRRPGVGLGRGLVGRCERMTLELSGGFSAVVMEPLPDTVTLEATGPGALRLSYRRADPADPEDALVAFTLRGLQDAWQFGHKRVRFANGGPLGVNVFLYEEPDFLFLNENFSLVRPPNVRRGFVDIHLEMMGGRFASSADVVRRRPTSDLELQQALINLSTMFGIGVSLLVEGVLVLLVTLAGAFRSRSGGEGA
jgi:hypothetical protein